MNKISFYKGVIALLVLLNISVLGYVYISAKHDDRPMRMRPGGPAKMMIRRLKLDQEQQRQFDLLRNDHHSRLEALRQQRSLLHDQLFHLLKAEAIDTTSKTHIMLQLQQNELDQEQLTFDHFTSLRAILRPEQLPLFNDLVEDVGRQLMGPPPFRDGPPPGRE